MIYNIYKPKDFSSFSIVKQVKRITREKVGHSGTYGAATTNYSVVTGASDEAVGTNYTAGGQPLDLSLIHI